ncbi:glycosyltransferase family 2 protein [Pseudomonas oligotrophica]|uniref:glycosyltransferase family 2 protein n=1 Tax=Pseudomonas oligotrophica TaxID=2912055 RepID=UPI001F221AC6|nr:glycosyltransferase family 2 protein [Pseudomonas oligotrophica]MCF7203584.1 glycosyltransferase family 2 protein [Pseudomonas oligotrophica]
MKIDILISTMNQANYDLLDSMRINSDCVVVNQCGKDSFEEFSYRGHKVKWINSSEIGLSRSRNLAIKNSSADICVLADDDLIYVEGYADLVVSQYDKMQDADLLAFVVEGIDRVFKTYPANTQRLNFISSMKVSSVQISFKRKKFVDNGISFKEEFGAGSTFYVGEENIMLSDCWRIGLGMYFVPLKIADIILGSSTWFEGFNKRYFIAKGACFAAMSKPLAVLLIVQFALRKQRLYKNESTLVQALKNMLKGRKAYLKGNYKI